MATAFKLATPNAASAVLSTELNSLATAGLAISSSAYSGNLDPFADIELAVKYTTSAPAAGTKVAELYLVPTIDGTNYAEGSASVNPQKALLIAVFESRNGSTSAFERLVQLGVSLPPGSFKFVLLNTSGKTLASSGNTVTIRPYQYQGA